MENKNDASDGSVSADTVTPAPATNATSATPQSPSTPSVESSPTTASSVADAPVAPEVSSEAPPPSNKPLIDPNDMGFLNDVSIALTIEIGRTQIKIRDLLNLTKDSIIDLNKGSGEPVDIYANGKMISRGHIITANGKYCVRLTSIAQPLTDKSE